MKRRIINFLLVMAVVLAVIPATVLAVNAEEMTTGGVVAHAVYVDSSSNGYGPTFGAPYSVTTDGEQLQPNYTAGNYWVRYGVFYQKFDGEEFLFPQTYEPYEGYTYYSYLVVHNPNGSFQINEELVDIQIPGYDVEYLGTYELETDDTVMIVYSATRQKTPIYVGGVAMYSGDYLAVGETVASTTRPSGGYAYYFNGKLTLSDYSYEGPGYNYGADYNVAGMNTISVSADDYAVIYANRPLTIDLMGDNTLIATGERCSTVFVYDTYQRHDLTIKGTGSLTSTDNRLGICALGSVTIDGGTIVTTGRYYGIVCDWGSITINNSNVTAVGQRALTSFWEKVTVNNSEVTAISNDPEGYAIHAYRGFETPKGLRVQAATTADGELGAYEAEKRSSYKKIVITKQDVVVGGVGMESGEYLAVGATQTTTTKPSGGYAYYEDGTLTLDNYSYEGQGYIYQTQNGTSAAIFANRNLTIQLVGNNTMTQTAELSDAIRVEGGWLVIDGTGSINCTATGIGLSVSKGVTINNGTVVTTGQEDGLYSEHGGLDIYGGSLTAVGQSGISVRDTIRVKGGRVSARTTVEYGSAASYYMLLVDQSMKIQAATTIDGPLVDYEKGMRCKRIEIGPALPQGPTLVEVDGQLRYVVNGEFSEETTLVEYEGEMYYVVGGVVNTANTLFKYNGKWHHVNGGKWVKDTTLVKYGGVWHYVKDGIKNNANTLVKFNGKWYHVNGGVWVKDTTLVKYGTTWHYVKNGVLNTENTLCKFNGKWYHVNGGKWVKDTTLVKYGGVWHYVKNGVLNTENTLCKYNGLWYHVNGGKWVKDTTLVKYGTTWHYVKNGVLNTENTLCKYNGQWYHVNGGKWVKDTTLVKYGGVWHYVQNGIKTNATTLVKYNGSWFYVKNGVLNTENTLCKYNGQWYHVNGGKWVKDTTLVKYGDSWFYVKNGIVDFTYNGVVQYNGKTYTVKKGVKV